MLSASSADAQPVFGVRTSGSDQRLVRFDTQTPGTIDADVKITGLQSSETIRGIDFDLFQFPEVLYAVGSSSRLYTINTTSGAATQVGSGAFSPALSGTSFGFESEGDELGVVSDADQNLRLDRGDGSAAADSDLAYDKGDANELADPNVVAEGFAGENLFAIDSGLDVLALHRGPDDPADDNTLTTVGSLGVDTGPAVGFDVSGGGNPYAVLDIGPGTSKLFLLDLETGAATAYPSGAKNTVGATITGGIAVQPQNPQLKASPSPFNVGDQPVGTMGPAITTTVTLTGGDALSSFNSAIVGSNKDDYFLTANLCQAGVESSTEEPPLKLPGDTCTLRIRFAPSALGTRTATFSFLEPKCCPDPSFFDIPLTGKGTSAPIGAIGPTGPTGPAGVTGAQGPAGPPGPIGAARLATVLLTERFANRAGHRLRLPYWLNEAAKATIEIRRGSKLVTRIAKAGHAGRNLATWNGRTSRRKVAGPGRYAVTLSAVTTDGRSATDRAALRVLRP